VYIYQLSHYAKLCIGIDVAKENLCEANKRKMETENIELIQMSAENLAFKENTFNAVIMIEVLEHIPKDEKAIGEISRVLKPGGKLIVTAPNKLFPFETHGFRIGSRVYGTKGLGFPFLTYLPERLRRCVANARVYTPWHFKKLLIRNGFSIITIKFLGPSLDTLKIKIPRIRRFVNQMQKLLNHIEALPILNTFLTTMIVYAEKVKE